VVTAVDINFTLNQQSYLLRLDKRKIVGYPGQPSHDGSSRPRAGCRYQVSGVRCSIGGQDPAGRRAVTGEYSAARLLAGCRPWRSTTEKPPEGDEKSASWRSAIRTQSLPFEGGYKTILKN
jgi:hypothetical protein